MAVSTTQDLTWVEEWWTSVRPYVFVRPQDNLLILLPNRAFKLNATAARLLAKMNEDVPFTRLIAGLDAAKRSDLYFFFADLKALASGLYNQYQKRQAITEVPFSLPFNRLPVLSEIALTYRCNLRCLFCYAGCGCTRGEVKEMSARQIKKTLDIIREKAQVPSVSFTGGEPALREDLPELVGYARGKGLRVNLISNGTLIDKKLAAKLCRRGLNSAQISIEAPEAELHDAISGVNGSWEASLTGLENLRAEDIHVHFNSTLNRRNLVAAERMPELAARLKLARLSMNMVIPCGSAKAHQDLWVSYSEIGDTVMRVRERARAEGVDLMWYSPTPMCLFNPIAKGLGNKACAAVDGLLSIAPNGDVLPCSSYPAPLGNLLSQDFDAVWGSEKARYFQEKKFAPSACAKCRWFAYCQGACPLYWQAVGEDELKPCSMGNGIISRGNS